MPKLRDRTTGDILVLMIASTICGAVILASIAMIILRIISPESGVSPALSAVTDIINTLIGLLAGFLAGRTDATLTAANRKQAEDAKLDNE